jgi:hypothetical protein
VFSRQIWRQRRRESVRCPPAATAGDRHRGSRSGPHRPPAGVPRASEHGVGNVRILHSLQDMHRAAGLDDARQHPVLAAVLDQAARYRYWDPDCRASLLEIAALGKRLRSRPKGLARSGRTGEIRRRRDQHHAGDLRAPLSRARSSAIEAQRDPASHGGADQDALFGPTSSMTAIAFLQPARNRAVGKGAAGGAVTGIVEPDAGSPSSRQGVEFDRLGAGHVGAVAAEPDERRPGPRRFLPAGDAIRAISRAWPTSECRRCAFDDWPAAAFRSWSSASPAVLTAYKTDSSDMLTAGDFFAKSCAIDFAASDTNTKPLAACRDELLSVTAIRNNRGEYDHSQTIQNRRPC